MNSNSTSHNRAGEPTTIGNRTQATPNKRATHARTARLRAKRSGQALIIVALSTVVLVAMVGLAVDGGSMYNERRTAQNGSDGGSMAGAREMLGYYEAIVAGTT